MEERYEVTTLREHVAMWRDVMCFLSSWVVATWSEGFLVTHTDRTADCSTYTHGTRNSALMHS